MFTVYWYIPSKFVFEDDSFSCGWLQAKFMIKEEFDVRCARWALEGLLTQTISFYVNHVVFDELLKETGHGSCIIV